MLNIDYTFALIDFTVAVIAFIFNKRGDLIVEIDGKRCNSVRDVLSKVGVDVGNSFDLKNQYYTHYMRNVELLLSLFDWYYLCYLLYEIMEATY